jgi:hypothetical protein
MTIVGRRPTWLEFGLSMDVAEFGRHISMDSVAGRAGLMRPIQASEMDSVSHQSGRPQQIPNLPSVDSVDRPITKRS